MKNNFKYTLPSCAENYRRCGYRLKITLRMALGKEEQRNRNFSWLSKMWVTLIGAFPRKEKSRDNSRFTADPICKILPFQLFNRKVLQDPTFPYQYHLDHRPDGWVFFPGWPQTSTYSTALNTFCRPSFLSTAL